MRVASRPPRSLPLFEEEVIPMRTQIEATIGQFVHDNYLLGAGETLTAEDSLIDRGLIDSMGVLELVTFLEDTFGIQMADDELVPENLDSIRRIVDFVAGKQRGTSVLSAAGSMACA
jgi:acyl carrier protein